MSIRDNIITSNFGIAGSSNKPSSATNPYQQYANELHKYYDTAPTLNIAGYQSLLNATRDIYAGMGVQDPDGAIKKQIVGSVLSDAFPQYTREQATKYASTIYKQATGYDVSEDELYRLFTGAFSSAAANFYTGYRSLELAADKYNMTDEEYEVAREEYLRDIKNTYKTYYNKEANEKAGNILGEIVYNMGNAAPSMIPGLLISASTILLSGGAGAPSASIMLWNALRHGTAYTGKQIALGVGGTVARSVSSALMEAGSISTELMENNVDPDVILKYSALTGVVAGLAEELISDAAWGKVTEWMGSLRKAVGQKAMTKAWKESFKEVLKEGLFDTLKVGFGEGLTEAAQEPTELLFTKHAYKMMEGRSAAGSDAKKKFKELADCSIEEYANAGWQAFKGAFAGQMGFGFLRTGVSAGVSARSIKRYKSASRISNPTDANGIVKASDIVFFGKGQQSESEAGKVAPVSVVKVGDKFVAFDATDDQKNAIANNSKEYIFVKETATKVPSSAVQLNYSMKLDDINKTIIAAYKNNDIYGFKYLDKNGKETSNMSNVATVLIATDDVESVAVEVSDKSESKLSTFETDIFGKTFTKYTETQENETTNETANEDESQRTADVSEQFDDLYEEAEETKRQEEANKQADKQAEKIKKETLNEETKTETQQTAETQEEAPVAEEKADVSAVSDDVKEAVIDLLKDKNELTEEDVASIVDESEGLNEATIRELYNEAQKEKKAEANTEPVTETKEETKQEDKTDVSKKVKNETKTEAKTETKTEEKPVVEKDAETLKAEENEKKLNDRVERMREGKEDSDKFKKAYRSIDSDIADADAKSAYDTFYKAFKDLKDSKNKFQSVIIDKLNDREIKRAARITTVVAIGFAKAQGKTINEFMQSFNVSSENPGVGEFSDINPLAQGWIKGADIYLSPSATPITIAHELAHHFLNTVDKNSDLYKDIEKTFKKTSLKDSNGKADISEAFAQGLERYLRDGIVSNEKLRGLFENLKDVFKGILNIRKNNNVTSEANRIIFDRIFQEDKAEIISDAVEKAKLESKDNKEIVKNTEKEIKKIDTEDKTLYNNDIKEGATEDGDKATVREGSVDRGRDDISSNNERGVSNRKENDAVGKSETVPERARDSKGNDNEQNRGFSRSVLIEEQLKKENPNARVLKFNKLESNESNATKFKNAIDNARKTQPFGLYVDAYDVNTTKDENGNETIGYSDPRIKLFMTEDESVGFAIKEDGDIVSVFADKTKGKHPLSVYSILLAALVNGGTKLDCYGERLLKFYMRMGFVPQGKVLYNEEYESQEWKERKSTLGSPDVYALYWGDSNIDETVQKFGERFQNITDKTASEVAKKLRVYEDSTISEKDGFKYETPETIYGYDLLMAERDISYNALPKNKEKQTKKEKIVIKQSDLKPAKVKETAKTLADAMTERAQETADVVTGLIKGDNLTAMSNIDKIDSSAIDKAKKESKTGNINDLDTSIKKSKMSIIGEQQSLDRYLVRNGLKSVDDKTTILSNGFLAASASLDRTLTAISTLAFKGIKISNRDFDIFRCSNGELAVKINAIYDREGNRIENKGNDIWLYIGKDEMDRAKALSADTGATTVDLQRGIAIGLRLVSDRFSLIDAMGANVATDKITASYNETVRKEVDKNLGKTKEIKDIPYDVKNETVESNLDKLYESDKPVPMKKKNDMSRTVADTVRKNILDNINDIYGMKTKDYEYYFSNDPETPTDLYQFDSSDVAKSINKALGINAFGSKDIFVYGDFDGNLIIKINKGIYTDENGNPVAKDSVVPTYIFIPSIYVDGMDSYPMHYVYDDRDMNEQFEDKFLDENGEFKSIDETKKPFKPIPYEYDARIVAEAFLQNYQYAIDDEFKNMQSSEIRTSLPEDGVPIMYSLAENTEDPALKEQREEQFIDMMAGIVVDNTPENTLRQLSKGDIEHNVFTNEKINVALYKLDNKIKTRIKKNIVAYLKDASESYPRIASRLAKVMTNKTEASKVRKEFIALIKEGLTHAESVKDFKKDITNSFRGEGFEEISATLNRIIDSCVADSKATVTNEEIDQVIRRFVNKDGTMVLYHINGDKNGTNPIIKFANWAHIGTDDDGNPVKVKNKPENAVDSDYMETSYRLLGSDNEFSDKNAREVKERLDSDEISITDLVSSLYANSGFYLPDFVKGVFTNYMSEDFLDKIILAYKENVERSSQQLHEANNDIIALSARIKALEKTNRDVSGWLEEQKLKNKKIIEGNKNANAKKDEIIKEKREQIEKNKAQIKELKDQLKNVIAEREKLKAEIAFMVENNVFTDAQKIKFEYNKLRKAITKSTGRDARAVEIMTPIMEMFDGESSGDAIDMKLFVPRWKGYENSLNGFAKKLIENGIIVKNSEGVWVIGKTLKECNLDELAVVSDAMNTYYKETTEEMNSRKKAYINGMMIDKKAIIDDIRKFYKLQDDNEDFAQAVRDFTAKNDLASAEKNGKKKKLFNSLEFEIMSNILQRECPAMYAYFFGGYIDYDIETQEGVEAARVFIKNNLNSATDKEKANTIKRKNAFVNKISELFDVKPDDVSIYSGRLFTGKTDTVGKIDFNDFQKAFGYMPIDMVQDPDNAMLTHYSVNENVPESMRPFMEFIVNRYQKNSDKLAEKWASLQKRRKLTQEERTEALQRYKQKENLYTEEELTDSFFSRDGIESSYNMSELMGIYLYSRQTDGIRDMLSGTDSPINTNNLTVGNILSVLAKFSLEEEYKPYRELSEYMLNDMGSRYTQTADVYYNITGKILDKIPNYFLIRDKIGFYEYEMGLLGQKVNKSSNVRNKSLLDRSGRHPLYLDVMSLYTQAIDEQEHYIAFAELCDRYDRMFFSDSLNRDEEGKYDVSLDVSKAFIYASEQSGTHNAPQAVIDALHSWYEIIKNPGDYRGSSSPLLGKMISNMATSVLWGNISVVLQQFPTYVLVMRRVGFKNMMNALMKNIAHPNTLQDFIYGKSAQMRDRARLDVDTYKQAVLDPNSWLGKKFGETGWKISEVEKKMIKAGLQPMETVDKWVVNASWMAVYEWNLENLERVDDMSDADFDEMCAQNATQFIMDTNSSKNAKDNALIYSNRDTAVKSLLLFTSQLNKQFNMIYGSVLDYKKNGKTREQFNAIMLNAATLGLAMSGALIATGAIVPKDKDDRELSDFLLNYLKQLGLETVGMFPLIGDPLKQVLNGDVYSETNLASTTVNAYNAIRRKSSGDKTLKDSTFYNALTSEIMQTFELVGLPSTQINKTYRAVRDKNPLQLVSSKWANLINEE